MPQESISTDNQFSHINKLLASMVRQIQGEYLLTLEDEWGEMYVIEDNDFRALKFDEIYEQSKMRISEPHYPVFNYTKAMLLGAALAPCQNVLMLGLGGGSLVRTLLHLNPEVKMTVVEIRPAVIELAFKYFALPASPNLEIVCSDAKQYLTSCVQTVDLIFADLFWAMRMDPLQTQNVFVESCRRQLSADGWLVINYEQQADIDKKMLLILYRHFEDVLLCAIPNGNAIVLAGSLSTSGGMCRFYPRLAAMEERLQCKMDILGKQLQRIRPPQESEQK